MDLVGFIIRMMNKVYFFNAYSSCRLLGGTNRDKMRRSDEINQAYELLLIVALHITV